MLKTQMKALIAGAALAGALSVGASAHADAGLNGVYYAAGVNLGNLAAAEADIVGLSPSATWTTTTVCFPSCNGGSSDGDTLSSFLGVPSGYSGNLSADFNGLSNHVIVLTGYLNLASAGNYAFTTFSDDGSKVIVDGNDVVTYDGDHGLGAVTGNSVALDAGLHTLRIVQFEDGGGTGLTVSMNGQVLTGALLQTNGPTTGGVPEPATWALMIMGFGAAGAALRRRRAVSATA